MANLMMLISPAAAQYMASGVRVRVREPQVMR
jgi:hypothetical protein